MSEGPIAVPSKDPPGAGPSPWPLLGQYSWLVWATRSSCTMAELQRASRKAAPASWQHSCRPRVWHRGNTAAPKLERLTHSGLVQGGWEVYLEGMTLGGYQAGFGQSKKTESPLTVKPVCNGKCNIPTSTHHMLQPED